MKGCRTFVSGRRNNRQRIRPYDRGWRSHTGTSLTKLPMLRQPKKENIENENLFLFVNFIDEKIWLDIVLNFDLNLNLSHRLELE